MQDESAADAAGLSKEAQLEAAAAEAEAAVKRVFQDELGRDAAAGGGRAAAIRPHGCGSATILLSSHRRRCWHLNAAGGRIAAQGRWCVVHPGILPRRGVCPHRAACKAGCVTMSHRSACCCSCVTDCAHRNPAETVDVDAGTSICETAEDLDARTVVLLSRSSRNPVQNMLFESANTYCVSVPTPAATPLLLYSILFCYLHARDGHVGSCA